MTEIRKVTVLGISVLGSQIAFQTAYSGLDVSVYDISEDILDQARKRSRGLPKSTRKRCPARRAERPPKRSAA